MARSLSIKRVGPDLFKVRVAQHERNVLEWLVPQLRELLVSGEAGPLRRLFPTAYAQDPEAEAAYRELVHDDLLEKRLAALDTIEESLESTELSAVQVEGWMHAVNSLRLVLGTRLDITPVDEQRVLDQDDPDLPLWAAYDILTFMLGRIVDALDD